MDEKTTADAAVNADNGENPEKSGRNSDQLVLDRNLSNAFCDELCDSLRAHLNVHQSLIVDAGQVEEIGTAGIQLLLSAIRTAGNANLPVQITNQSDAFRDALSDLGLKDCLTQWNVAA